MDKNIGRIAVLAYYNFQQIRLQLLNQIRDILRRLNENIPFDAFEEKKDEKSYDAQYSDKNLLPLLEQLTKEKKISKQTSKFLEDCLITVLGGEDKDILTCPHCDGWFYVNEHTKGIVGIENRYKKLMEKFIKDEMVFTEFLDKIRGVGIIHGANLIKAFGDCGQYSTLSKLRAHCGYSVGKDNKAPHRKKGEKIKYNPELKTMVWKITHNLMMHNKGFYRKLYNEYKEKQLEREYEPGFLCDNYNGYEKEDIKLSKGHAHNRALRKIGVLFLSHFWEASRELNGLPAVKTYVEDILNHSNIIYWKDVLKMEGCLSDKSK
ncbi:MAG: transposase [Promethearchaeota archaeon]